MAYELPITTKPKIDMVNPIITINLLKVILNFRQRLFRIFIN